MTVSVETGSMRHLDRLCEIEKECFGEEAFGRQQIANLLADYNSISLVALANDRVVGFVIGALCVERGSLEGHVLTIDVSHSHGGSGVGMKLLLEIERIFAEKSARTCHLEVREDNVKALGLYEKAGYERIGRLKNYYGKVDGLYLRKSLA